MYLLDIMSNYESELDATIFNDENLLKHLEEEKMFLDEEDNNFGTNFLPPNPPQNVSLPTNSPMDVKPLTSKY